ncbi:hypothetical protein [Nitrosopumilus sp. S4]
MADELDAVIKQLAKTDEKINEVSQKLVILKHEYRRILDKKEKQNIKKKWDATQKKMDALEKKRRVIVEKKNEIEFKRKWKGWK